MINIDNVWHSVANLLQCQQQELMHTFLPKKYVKNPQKLEQYECTVCYELATDPYYCTGPCKKVLCWQCVSQIISSHKKECPQRCSAPLRVAQCKEVEMQFVCPFNSQECQAELHSISQFQEHDKTCKYVPKEWKERVELVRNYKCEKGHDLFFMSDKSLYKLYGYFGFFKATMNSMCFSCGEQTLCRTICPTCSSDKDYILFCHKCRKVPCTRSMCPHEHELNHQEESSYDRLCDFCGVGTLVRAPTCVTDKQCNFDICMTCYDKLPQQHQLVPSKMSVDCISHLRKQNVFEEDQYMNLVQNLQFNEEWDDNEWQVDDEQLPPMHE